MIAKIIATKVAERPPVVSFFNVPSEHLSMFRESCFSIGLLFAFTNRLNLDSLSENECKLIRKYDNYRFRNQDTCEFGDVPGVSLTIQSRRLSDLFLENGQKALIAMDNPDSDEAGHVLGIKRRDDTYYVLDPSPVEFEPGKSEYLSACFYTESSLANFIVRSFSEHTRFITYLLDEVVAK
jgi:hypothetical protein